MKNMGTPDKEFISDFIQSIWNENKLEEISAYLHDEFVDYSMPYAILQNKQGLLMYLKELALKVSHHTDILELSVMENLVICKIKISAVNLSDYLKADNTHEVIEGFRIFKVSESRIIAHWEII